MRLTPFRRYRVAVASGKGGTGKTLVATNLAVAAARSGTPVALVDCDVEAPNDALFLRPAATERAEVTFPLATVDEAACTGCGVCRDACAYGAIRLLGRSAIVFDELCHGCGACIPACPTGAIREVSKRVGRVVWGRVGGTLTAPASIDVVTGELDVGEVKAPTVIRAAKRRSEVLARPLTILDAPPGTSCSAVHALKGADALVLVTEPTPFGLHDVRLAVELGRALDLPMGVVVNRSGEPYAPLDAFIEAERLPRLASIPFDRRIAEVYAMGELVIDEHPDGRAWFEALWDAVQRIVEER